MHFIQLIFVHWWHYKWKSVSRSGKELRCWVALCLIEGMYVGVSISQGRIIWQRNILFWCVWVPRPSASRSRHSVAVWFPAWAFSHASYDSWSPFSSELPVLGDCVSSWPLRDSSLYFVFSPRVDLYLVISVKLLFNLFLTFVSLHILFKIKFEDSFAVLHGCKNSGPHFWYIV